MKRFLLLLLLVATYCEPLSVRANDLLQKLGEAARDTKEAGSILKSLGNQPDLTLVQVLSAMKSQSAIANNYLVSLAQTVADRNPQQSVADCRQFLQQVDQDPTARYWAFSYVTSYEPELREPLLEQMTADPAADLRYEAIELQLKRLESDDAGSNKVGAYKQLLNLARLPEQVQNIAKRLDAAGEKVNLLEHFGFLSQWQAVGPFDNVGQGGFDVVYDPEQEYLAHKLPTSGTLSNTYVGKLPDLKWQPLATDAADGKVDLNAPYKNAKGAVVYALGKFVSKSKQTAELRVGCPCAVKVWVNGDLLITREVYHAGDQIDQYIAPVELKPGDNSILVKACQNEQTESWAQDWFFQLRMTDATGQAIPTASSSK